MAGGAHWTTIVGMTTGTAAHTGHHVSRMGPSRHDAALVMGAGVALSALLLLALLALGWGPAAWATAAAVVLVLCAATCVWAGAIGRRSARDVERAVDLLAAARRAAAQAPRREAVTEGGAA